MSGESKKLNVVWVGYLIREEGIGVEWMCIEYKSEWPVQNKHLEIIWGIILRERMKMTLQNKFIKKKWMDWEEDWESYILIEIMRISL